MKHLRRVVVGAEKSCKLHLHNSIVKANKKRVNVYYSSGDNARVFVNEMQICTKVAK